MGGEHTQRGWGLDILDIANKMDANLANGTGIVFQIEWITGRMEGPDLSGPSVWVDLNKKNSDKIIGFISKNKVPQKFDNLAPKPDQCLVLLLRENMVE